MLRATGLLGLGAVMVLAVAAGAAPAFVDISKAVPTGALQPYVIPEQLQKMAVDLKVPSNFEVGAYIAVFKFKFTSGQLFYTDLLTGVDVLAQAWAKKRGATPSAAASGNPHPVCI